MTNDTKGFIIVKHLQIFSVNEIVQIKTRDVAEHIEEFIQKHEGKRRSQPTSGLLRLEDTRHPEPTSRSHCFLPWLWGSKAEILPSRVLMITRDLRTEHKHTSSEYLLTRKN